jgi:hypothetical protein
MQDTLPDDIQAAVAPVCISTVPDLELKSYYKDQNYEVEGNP